MTMTKEQKAALTKAVSALKAIRDGSDGDPEASHSKADKILCDALREMGYPLIAEEWEACRDAIGF